MKLKKTIIGIICIGICGFVFFRVLNIFKVADGQIFQSEAGFYAQDKNSLDVVFVGSSAVNRFFQPPLVWKDYGITSWSLSTGNMNAVNFPYLIKEIDKTQPDALIILSLNSFKSLKVDKTRIMRCTNYLNFSLNKLEMIHDLADRAGYKGTERLQFYFPIIQFHSRWPSLKSSDFTHKLNGYKTGFSAGFFLNDQKDISKKIKITDDESVLTEDQAEFLETFLKFLEQCGHDVLIVGSPQSFNGNVKQKQLNRICSIFREHGYECLNYINMIDEIGLQTENDFYNINHTNIHGSIKFTDYLTGYLVEKYGLTDKRGLPGYKDWEDAAVLYDELISQYTLEFERDHAPRDYELAIPVLKKPTVEQQTITLSWKESPHAEAYDIYRKSNASDGKNWAYIGSTESTVCTFVDEGLMSGTKYTYTVVPKRTENGGELYGNFNYAGVSASVK